MFSHGNLFRSHNLYRFMWLLSLQIAGPRMLDTPGMPPVNAESLARQLDESDRKRVFSS